MSVNLSDSPYAYLRSLLGTRSHGKAGLAIHGANLENVQTTAGIDFSIDGVVYSFWLAGEIDLSALTVIDPDTGDTTTISAQADDTDRIYLLALTSAGAVRIIQGVAVETGETCYCPQCPVTLAPFGAVKVENNSGATFTFGTTSLGAAGITDSYYDLCVTPVSL